MNSAALIQRLHQHRAWVNENLLVAATALAEDQLRREFQIGQGSIWKSLLHLYAAEFVWLEALLGNDNPLVQGDLPGRIPGNQMGEGGIASLDELREKWVALQKRWDSYLADLLPESLDDSVFKVASAPASGLQSLAAPRAAPRLHSRPTHHGPGCEHAEAGRRRKAA